MANRIYGEARAHLSDGRELTLRFDFGALAEAEEAADKGTEAMMAELAKGGARLKTARAMLYGALRYHHPEISLGDAGELLLSDSSTISGAMGRAMQEMADRRAKANPPTGAAAKAQAAPWDWDALFEVWSESGLDPAQFWRQTPRTFGAIMRGRGKYEAERIINSAYTGEAFARRKILKPAEHYLKQAERGRAKPPPSAVVAMASRMQKAGLAVTVRRIPPGERANYNGWSNARLP